MNRKKKIIRVRHVMKTEVDVVDGMLTVAAALKVMKYPNTSTLIVDKRDENDEYGVVMFRDVARQVLAHDRSPDRVNVYEIMSKPAIHVDPEMDIRYCARLFDQFGLSRAPVLDQGRVIGLVSYSDIVLNGFLRAPD
ncbi:MAG: CBS domain-containing protein [Xanthomonadales bacterium]|nr:CBS domain-containing protein [Xanthomonadales bacterium]NNL95311.1 CBS domain-containing protein [Xanthomonadales bacterium]